MLPVKQRASGQSRMQIQSRRRTNNPVRRRVRTGCLTCRRRRRKCDEGKPECQNCRDKFLTCQYGLRLRFLDATPGSSRGQTAKLPALEPTVSAGSHRPNESSSLDDELPAGTFSATDSPDAPQYSDRSPALPSLTAHSQGPTPQIESEPAILYTPAFAPDEQALQASNAQPYTSEGEVDMPLDVELGVGVNSRAHVATIGTLQAIAPPPETCHDNDETLRLLSHYRHYIAPLLDLDHMRSFWGVQVLVQSTHSLFLRNTLIALAANHLNNPRVQSPYPHAGLAGNAEGANATAYQTAVILSAWSKIYALEPVQWARCLEGIPTWQDGALNVDQWQLLARLVLASSLMASYSSGHVLLLLPRTPAETHDQSRLAHHFVHSMLLLRKSIDIATLRPSHTTLASTWISCWNDCQLWFEDRGSAMEELLVVPEANMPGNDHEFPCIMFCSASAFLANVVHHLTCLVLLQQKMRTIKTIAKPISSISPIWHARRVVGICASSKELDRWDPLVIAALFQAYQNLSHGRQHDVVIDVLERAARCSNMTLSCAIRDLRNSQ